MTAGGAWGFNEAGAFMPRKAASAVSRSRRRICASMRPGLLCPGRRAAICRGTSDEGDASMRPGLLCPGRLAVVPVCAGDSLASMRPGLLCPGSWIGDRYTRGGGGCFNEAGAFMPRKDHGAIPWPHLAKCFNEAGAFMPRKGSLSARERSTFLASMRPGLLCPGRVEEDGALQEP